MKRSFLDEEFPRKQIKLEHFIPDDLWPCIFSYVPSGWIGPLERVCKKWKQILETNTNAFNFMSYPLYLMAVGYEYQPLIDPDRLTGVLMTLNKGVNQYKRHLFTQAINPFLIPFQKHFTMPISIIVHEYSPYTYSRHTVLGLRLKFGSSSILLRYTRESSDFKVHYSTDDMQIYQTICSTREFNRYKTIHSTIINDDAMKDKCILKTFTADIFMEMVLVLYFHDQWRNFLEVLQKFYFSGFFGPSNRSEHDFYELVIAHAPFYN